jgi:hypothetical protein
VSLDCPFLIPISVFANVYLTTRFVGVGTNSVFCPLCGRLYSLILARNIFTYVTADISLRSYRRENWPLSHISMYRNSFGVYQFIFSLSLS